MASDFSKEENEKDKSDGQGEKRKLDYHLLLARWLL